MGVKSCEQFERKHAGSEKCPVKLEVAGGNVREKL